MRLTRRTVLAISGLAISPTAAANPPRVEPTDDGGFRVLTPEPAWHQSGAELRAALGEDVQLAIATDAPQVTLRGTLAGESVLLRLAFAKSGSALTVATHGRLGRRQAFEGRPRPFPLLLDERVEVDTFARALGLNPAGATHLTLDDKLALRLVSHAGFALGQGLTTTGPLRLLAGSGVTTPLAVIDQPVLRGRRTLGERGGAAFNLEPKPFRLLVVASDGPARHLRIEGGGNLTIADTRLRYGLGSTVRFAATGPNAGAWWLDLLLPLYAQRVDTPEGRVVLSGTGGSDIVAEGAAGRVRSARGQAVLRHAALRLPLQANGRGYADLGRLDFDANTRVTLAIAEADGAELPQGRIPLTSGAGPMRLRLDTADLWAGRDADMFHARFGFRGLDLIIRRRIANLQRRRDAGDETTLIVRLPPQHVMEEAFPRIAPRLPGRDLQPEELPSAFEVVGRKRLADQLGQNDAEFRRFSEKFKKRYAKLVSDAHDVSNRRRPPTAPYPSAKTDELEKIYVGPDGMITPIGRRAARETAQSLAQAQLPKLEDLLLGLSEIMVSDVLRRHNRLEIRPSDDAAIRDATDALSELLDEAAKRQADMARVILAWRQEKDSGPLLLSAWRTSWPSALRPGATRVALAATLAAIPTSQPTFAVEAALQQGYSSAEPPQLPVKARAAGETRLAFSLRMPPGGLPWSLATLLDWGAMDLRVSTRAETLLATAGTTPADTPADTSDELQRLLAKQLGMNESKGLQERLVRLRDILRCGPGDAETAIELPARLILSPDRGGARLTTGSSASAQPDRFAPRFHASAAPRGRTGRVPLWRADLHETPGSPYSLRAIHTPDYEPEAYPFGKPPSDPLRHPERGLQAGQRVPEVFALDDFDRRQIVALSSLHGLPVLARRGAGGVIQTSQVSPPESFRISTGLQEQDAEEQALYVPRPLPSRMLRLTALGGTLDLVAPFVPPAPLRADGGLNIFSAHSLERVRILIALGREVTTEVVYKGFLYPLGFRAALLKVTERQYLPWPGTYDADPSRWRGPLAFQVQRFFIQVANPEKTYPGVGQPFGGRAWPARALTMLTQRTPDLLDPTRSASRRPSEDWPDENWEEALNGRLDQKQRAGLVFWPRTAQGERGNIRFRFAVDRRPEPVSMPLIFVDNEAAHDAPTMHALQRYWNAPEARARSPQLTAPNADADTRAWEALRRLDHAGAPRRYAEEDVSGDTTFETLTWDVRVDSREAALSPRYLPQGTGDGEPPGDPPSIAWQMNSAMESDDQPPFYPRCLQATIRHNGAAELTGNPQADVPVRFLHDYLETGLPVLRRKEIEGKTLEEREAYQATVLAKQRCDTAKIANGGHSTATDPLREAFLRVAGSPPKQTMGRNGARSSGVMRPEMVYPFIGRKGPIGGKKPPAESPNAVPETVNEDFVLPDARICGLVSLQEVLKLAKNAAAPLLRQTVEYGLGEAAGQANAVAKEFAGRLIDVLWPVLKRFDIDAGDSAKLLREAYSRLWSSMVGFNTALVNMKTIERSIDALPAVVTAGREVRGELDRLAANPLGPLTEVGQQLLTTTKDQIESAARIAIDDEMAKIQLGALSQALRDAFVQRGEALIALDDALEQLPRLPTQAEATAEAAALRAHAARAFERATREVFTVPLKDLPSRLTDLRRKWREQVRTELDADPVPSVPPARLTLLHDAIESALARLDGLPAPPVLARFYATLLAFVNPDSRGALPNWRGALRELEREGVRRLRAWASSELDDACSAAGTKVAVAAQRLREALLATAIPRPCEPAVCSTATPPSPAAEICARLWALCTRNALGQPAAAVGAALARLEAAVAGFGQGNPCAPNPAEGAARLMLELRRLDVARAVFGTALAQLLKALAQAAEQQMEDAAAREAAVLAAALLALLRPPQAAFGRLQTALEPALGDSGALAAVNVLRDADATVGSAQVALEAATDANSLALALAKLNDAGLPAKALDALVVAGRATVDDLLFAAALPAAQAADEAAKRLLGAMDVFLDKAQAMRSGSAQEELRRLDQRLGLRGEEQLAALLYLDFKPRFPALPSEPIVGKDALDRERERITAALDGDAMSRADTLADMVQIWFLGGNGSSVDQILRNLGDRLLAAARHRLLRVLDVDRLRTELEAELAKLVPARRKFDYAWAVPALDKELDLGIVSFKGGGFQVRAEAVLDLMRPSEPLTGSVSGSIADFDIGISTSPGGPKLLTLFFSGIRFEGAPGAAARVEEPKLKSFKPEGFLVFLAGLAVYCKLQGGDSSGAGAPSATPGVTPVPNGIYTIPRPGGGTGLRAGYGLSFGALQIGTMAILDVVFDAHVELPFDGDPGHAQVSCSTPENPATMVCAPYGGTAYARLRSVAQPGKAELATEFDVAFQFGAAVAFSFGILKGSGRVMTGLRVFDQLGGPGFSALFVAAFEGHIACFGIAASFVLTMTYRRTPQGNKLSGRAALTYSFSVGPLKKSFTVHVTRNAGQGLENNASLELPARGEPRIMLANAYLARPAPRRPAHLHADVPGMMQAWPRYAARYANPHHVLGRRRRA
jgi:hypothetical protein